ncbi:hypothetical protein [Fulvivirga sp.]|uniref:hypothetical protein n=1 Tax=Fulvivirga sp. TaxID=1931237 RepID=UPI0032EEA7B5
MITITNINDIPHTKSLLLNLISIRYEQEAVRPDDKSLIDFYYQLKENNELHKLFEAENLSSEQRLMIEFS